MLTLTLSATYTASVAHSAKVFRKRGIRVKTLFLFLTLAVAAWAAVAGDETPFHGKWAVHTLVAGNESDSECTFTQTGSELAGSCVSDRGTVEIKGKAEGNAASWEFRTEHDGTPLVVAYKGKLEGEKMTGTMSVDAFGVEGEFTATRPK